MSPRFRVEALAATHDRLSFSSGVEPLDRYLRELATHDIKRRISNCFVALDDAASLEAAARASLAGLFPRRRPQLLGFLRALPDIASGANCAQFRLGTRANGV